MQRVSGPYLLTLNWISGKKIDIPHYVKIIFAPNYVSLTPLYICGTQQSVLKMFFLASSAALCDLYKVHFDSFRWHKSGEARPRHQPIRGLRTYFWPIRRLRQSSVRFSAQFQEFKQNRKNIAISTSVYIDTFYLFTRYPKVWIFYMQREYKNLFCCNFHQFRAVMAMTLQWENQQPKRGQLWDILTNGEQSSAVCSAAIIVTLSVRGTTQIWAASVRNWNVAMQWYTVRLERKGRNAKPKNLIGWMVDFYNCKMFTFNELIKIHAFLNVFSQTSCFCLMCLLKWPRVVAW